jgi:hypothetical protein
MKIGDLVWDWSLKMNGIIVDGPWTENLLDSGNNVHPIIWEWLVLDENGDLVGADTNDLGVAE